MAKYAGSIILGHKNHFLIIKKWFWHHEIRIPGVNIGTQWIVPLRKGKKLWRHISRNRPANFLKCCILNGLMPLIMCTKFQINQMILTLFYGVWDKNTPPPPYLRKSYNAVGSRIKREKFIGICCQWRLDNKFTFSLSFPGFSTKIGISLGFPYHSSKFSEFSMFVATLWFYFSKRNVQRFKFLRMILLKTSAL